MSDLKQARLLLAAAEKDVSALRGMGDPAVFADEIFGFHVQQATEKLLKALVAEASARSCVVEFLKDFSNAS